MKETKIKSQITKLSLSLLLFIYSFNLHSDDAFFENSDQVNIFNQAVMLYNSEKYSEVVEAVEQLLALNPNIAQAYNLRGNAYFSLAKYNLAIEDFTKAINLNKSFSEAYRSRAETYRSLAQYDLALSDMNKLIELVPENSNYYFNLICT